MTIDTESSETGLTLADVALLMAGEIGQHTGDRLVGYLRSDPRAQPQLEALKALARDAGLDPADEQNYDLACEWSRELDRLLAAECWEHPNEVLDPAGDRGLDYKPLIRLAEARAGQEAGAERILSVKRRLERAAADELEEEALLERFVAGLMDREPERARRLLKQAEGQYQWRCRRAEAARADASSDPAGAASRDPAGA